MSEPFYDISKFSEQEKEEWANYGVIPGPLYNNFDLCPAEDYVASFECLDKGKDNRPFHAFYDLYVTKSGPWQSVVLREDESWEGSYGSSPLHSFITIPHKPWRQALEILFLKGKIIWEKRCI